VRFGMSKFLYRQRAKYALVTWFELGLSQTTKPLLSATKINPGISFAKNADIKIK